MSNTLAAGAAHLDGYLSGLAAGDGDIREYTAGAFVVPTNDDADSPESLVRKFYSHQADLQFSSSQSLESRDLENQLRSYVIRRPWQLAGQVTAQQLVDDRRRFLAFRIMDMIEDIAPKARRKGSVYKLESSGDGSTSEVTFFCIRIDAGLLVLQFNNDAPFIRAQQAKTK
jgi:hypothetical protein